MKVNVIVEPQRDLNGGKIVTSCELENCDERIKQIVDEILSNPEYRLYEVNDELVYGILTEVNNQRLFVYIEGFELKGMNYPSVMPVKMSKITFYKKFMDKYLLTAIYTSKFPYLTPLEETYVELVPSIINHNSIDDYITTDNFTTYENMLPIVEVIASDEYRVKFVYDAGVKLVYSSYYRNLSPYQKMTVESVKSNLPQTLVPMYMLLPPTIESVHTIHMNVTNGVKNIMGIIVRNIVPFLAYFEPSIIKDIRNVILDKLHKMDDSEYMRIINKYSNKRILSYDPEVVALKYILSSEELRERLLSVGDIKGNWLLIFDEDKPMTTDSYSYFDHTYYTVKFNNQKLSKVLTYEPSYIYPLTNDEMNIQFTNKSVLFLLIKGDLD